MELRFNKFFIQYPAETEILGETPLHDITAEELNEVMEEIERGVIKIKDKYPLKNIRESVLNT